MKIHLPFLLLFAVVTTCCSAAEQHQQQQQQSASGNTGGSIDLSVNLSADEPESRSTQSKHGEQSSSSSSSSLSQSASTPFATYSSAERDHSQQQQQVVPEFGMRNPPKTSSSSSSSTQQSDHQKAFANYAAEQAQLTFEPSISSAYKHSSTGSSSGVVTREFSPSVYRMSDSAATNHGELLNAHESDQTYGQATRISHEMDSPYYSKTTAVDGSGGAASGGENSNSGDNGGFTPISMSVDEAFRKYFPAQKQDQEGGEQQQQQQQQQQNSGDVYGSSNQQQQQQQQTPKSSTQYITTYASDDGENAQQQHQQQQPPQPAKELFSIDSLREIVDKQPLARPDPFDPPSPPLSAFLPPPPEGSIRETQPAAQSNAVPQFGSLSSGGQQELLHHQQQQQQQLYSSQPQQQQQQIIHQQYAAPPQQAPSSYVYKETIVESPIGGSGSSSAATSGAGGGVVHTSATSLNEESELPAEEGEDEGLPYNTENLDEEGKKLSYVYSRPVRLPDVSAGKIEGGGVSQYEVTPSGGVGAEKQYNSEMEHIYRKPVSYENEEDSVDHGDEGSPYGSRQPQQQQQITPQGYEEADKSMPYQQGVLTMPLNQQMVSMYSDDGNYNGKPGVQQQQQWTSGNDNRQAEFVDQSGQKDSQGPQAPIEYGGFVPIKKPGSGPQQQHQLTSFQTVGGGDVYSMEKQLSPPKGSNFFNVDPRPNYQLSAGVIPADHSGYVGPNNMSPMAGHVGGYQPQQPQQQPQQQQSSKYGNQVGNFLSKFPNLRFKPLYGKDAMKKLRELGISEDEFYGTVNKILKNSGVGPRPGGGPIYSGQLPFQMPKANLYRAPPKGGAPPHQHHHHHRHPSSMSGNGGAPQMGPGGPSKMRPLGNGIPDEFDFNYFKDALPPGASYNPRDVGLDESVLAQIQLQDSGIGGYRFPTMIPTGTNILTTPGGGASKHHHRRPGPLSAFAKGPGKGAAAAAAAGGASVPHAMNSIAMPFVLAGPRGPFGGGHHRGRVPYSATGKGFRSQYGYRAAASELKPQFVLPTKGSNAFKFLGQPVGSTGSSSAGSGATSLTSALLSSALLDDGSGLGGSGSGSLGNIFGIRSIKGIKSLVSYLTGGVSG